MIKVSKTLVSFAIFTFFFFVTDKETTGITRELDRCNAHP